MNEKWYHRTGNMGETVISTRVRLARNLKGFPFPDRMSLDQAKQGLPDGARRPAVQQFGHSQ